MRPWWIVAVVWLGACARRPPVSGDSPSAATVSPPVTVEAFRAAFPTGTTLLLRFTRPDTPAIEERWTWTRTDATEGVIHSLVCDADGNVVEDQGEQVATWTELMAHADFPADRTEQSEASVVVPGGLFQTWLFTVRETAEDGTPRVARYHFDRNRPGPPVLLTREEGGTETLRMELMERVSSPEQSSGRCVMSPPP